MQIIDWGITSYRDAWNRQKEIVENIKSGKQSHEAVILTEHYPVFTLGFHGHQENLIASHSQFESFGAECVRIERGGDITYHGPGQLVVYPIINLSTHKLGVKKYIELLESIVNKLLHEFGIDSDSNSEAIGVWLDWGGKCPRKICAIGVKISRGITMHGLALNVNNDLKPFSMINPCGFTDKGVTSMKEEKGHEVDITLVKQRISELFKEALSKYNA